MAILPNELRKSLRQCERSPNDAFECFFDWYNDAWLMQDDLWAALENIPRPVREIMVTHQAWGLMSGGGPNAYYWRLDRRFDEEIRLGLSVLDCAESFVALARGRELHSMRTEGFTLQENLEIDEHLISLEELEKRIGDYFLAAMRHK